MLHWDVRQTKCADMCFMEQLIRKQMKVNPLHFPGEHDLVENVILELMILVYLETALPVSEAVHNFVKLREGNIRTNDK